MGALIARGGWLLLGAVAVLCLMVGTENVVVAHMDAIQLSHIPGSPGDNDTGAASGLNDWFIVLVGAITVCSFVLASYRLVRGHYERGPLTVALFGALLVCFDAYLVGGSGWLRECMSCGGEPQVAQDEAARAWRLTGVSAFCALAGLIWLSLREDYIW